MSPSVFFPFSELKKTNKQKNAKFLPTGRSGKLLHAMKDNTDTEKNTQCYKNIHNTGEKSLVVEPSL